MPSENVLVIQCTYIIQGTTQQTKPTGRHRPRQVILVFLALRGFETNLVKAEGLNTLVAFEVGVNKKVMHLHRSFPRLSC